MRLAAALVPGRRSHDLVGVFEIHAFDTNGRPRMSVVNGPASLLFSIVRNPTRYSDCRRRRYWPLQRVPRPGACRVPSAQSLVRSWCALRCDSRYAGDVLGEDFAQFERWAPRSSGRHRCGDLHQRLDQRLVPTVTF
jgi:hypothetical protein